MEQRSEPIVECGAEVCHKCALKHDGDCIGPAPDEQGEHELEPCHRCGAPIKKGDEICSDCMDDLNYDGYCDRQELHERYEQAARNGEL